MFIDGKLQFDSENALSASAASTDVLDLDIKRNIGVGEPMAVVISLDSVADDTDGNETYSVELQTDSDSGFGSAVSLGSASIPAGSEAGSYFVIPVPADGRADQYFRLSYSLGGTTPSVTVTSFLIPQSMVQNYFKFDNAYTIS